MSLGRVLTLGYGAFGDKTTITLGLSFAAQTVATFKIHGGDDEVDYYEENRRKRLARLKADDDALIRIIVTGVTKGWFG